MCLYEPTSATPGVVFSVNNCASYKCEWVQIINNAMLTSVNPSGQACSLSFAAGLDFGGPLTYTFAQDSADSPSVKLPWHPGDLEGTDSMNVSTFLMFEANNNGVWVPLWRVDWQWSGDAYLPASPGTGWAFRTTPTPPPPGTTLQAVQTSSYPAWNQPISLNGSNLPPCSSQPAPAVSSLVVNPSQVASGASASVIVGLNAPAPSGGAVVNLSGGGAVFSAPATCTVAAGLNTQTCSGTAGTVMSSTTVTVTAVYNNSSQSASITVVPQQ